MRDVDLVRHIAGMPLRTARWQDVADVTTNAARKLTGLAEAGAVAKIASGTYTVPPNGADGRVWKVPLEAGGLAVATVRFGERRCILMGIGAARFWGAIPRALGTTVVAIMAGPRAPITLTTQGRVVLVDRDFGAIDATLEPTELGAALVTTPAQTLFDLLARPARGGHDREARAAARVLAGQVGAGELAEIAAMQHRIPIAVHEFLRTGTL